MKNNFHMIYIMLHILLGLKVLTFYLKAIFLFLKNHIFSDVIYTYFLNKTYEDGVKKHKLSFLGYLLITITFIFVSSIIINQFDGYVNNIKDN